MSDLLRVPGFLAGLAVVAGLLAAPVASAQQCDRPPPPEKPTTAVPAEPGDPRTT
ncbi:MAG: hypothetical protein JNL07_06770 [Rhodospirillales bacterium]|nr:hypothetical protein [Rhodospirillales bacterium]